MGSEEHNTTTHHRKVSATLSELEESFEEKEKKEKEMSISHRNLVKIESLAIGEQYIGEMKDNKREGQGTCIYKNGDKYEGFWKNNKKEGKGIYYYTHKGEMYKGNFFNDYPNGKGVYFYKNGDKYEGMFKDGQEHGEGIINYVNGTRYKGEFKNGKKHGKGEFKNQNGVVSYQFWDNGSMKKHSEKDNENDSVNLQNENDTKKFGEFFKNRENYKKKLNEKTSLFDKFKSIKEKSKNRLNDQQLVVILNIVKEKPNIKLWTIDDVKELFTKINLDKYIPNIEQNSVDGKKLLFLDNQSISNIFGITDKNDIKIISILIEFIGDIHNIEKEKINDDDNKISKRETNKNLNDINNKENSEKNKMISKENKFEKRNSLTVKFKDFINQEKYEKDEEEKKEENYVSDDLKLVDEQEKEKENKELYMKNVKKGKSEFYSSLNNNSLKFFIEYDEIKKERPIGKGGMGELYLGEWQGKQIALKKIKLNHIKNNLLSYKFINEINIIASMRHPNILLFMGVTIDNNTYYMITEYLPSGSLHEYLHLNKNKQIKSNPLTDKQKIKIALQIAIAVQYIHSRQILHCDLKSANVLIDKNFNIKLIDFGLSYFMSEAPKGYIGTARWMAPEILNGGEYSIKSDIFSYGMILMELLTEKIPYFDVFNYEVGKDIIKKHVNRKIQNNEDILTVPKTGNYFLRNIIPGCLKANPEERLSLNEIIKILSKANKCYEEIDEISLDMLNFLS